MFGIVCNEYVVPCQIVNLILQKYVFKKNKKQAFQQKIETSHKKMAFPKITLNARNMKHIYSSHWIRNNNKNKKRNITQIHCPYCLHLCCQMVNPILLPFYFYRTCKSDFFSIEFWITFCFLLKKGVGPNTLVDVRISRCRHDYCRRLADEISLALSTHCILAKRY